MKRHRQSGYALIYILAALPLLMVIGNLTVRVVAQSLRAQRVATREAAVGAARQSIAERLREDAVDAVSVRGVQDGYGDELTLRSATRDIDYVSSNGVLTRVVTVDGSEQQRNRWVLEDTEIGFWWEPVTPEAGVVWLRFEHALSMDPRLPSRREMATAVQVRIGGAQ